MANPQEVVPKMFRFTPLKDVPGSHELTEVEHLMVKLAKSFTDLLKMSSCLKDQDLASIAERPEIDPAMRTALRRPRTRIAHAIVNNYICGRMPLVTDILYTKYPSAFISLIPSLRQFNISPETRNELDSVWNKAKLTISSLLGVKRTAPEEDPQPEDLSVWPPPLPQIKDPTLLKQVFTHRSANASNATAAERNTQNNERLEFKGDTILGVVVVDLIYKEFPSYSEGDLSKLKSRLVSNKLLQELTLSYELHTRLVCSAGVNKIITDAIESGSECKFIADLFEAYIGGAEIDRGFEACRDWLHQLYAPLIKQEKEQSAKHEVDKMAKVELHRLIGADIHQIEYETTPHENGIFEAKCVVDGAVIGRGTGPNKREASSAAAMDAMNNREAIRKFSEERIAAKAQRKKVRDARAKQKYDTAVALAKAEAKAELEAGSDGSVDSPEYTKTEPGSDSV